MLPAFGKELRKLRLDYGEILKNMAIKLGYSSSYLSSIEVGKRNIPEDMITRLAQIYKLDDSTVHNLESAKAQQTKDISLGLDGASPQQSEVALVFARRFKDLDEVTSSKILKLINNAPKDN